jgi:fructose-1-phosphate kinase PfkB-like protein
MGEAVLATGVIGGTIGDYIIQELTKSDIRNHFYKINQEINGCFKSEAVSSRRSENSHDDRPAQYDASRNRLY